MTKTKMLSGSSLRTCAQGKAELLLVQLEDKHAAAVGTRSEQDYLDVLILRSFSAASTSRITMSSGYGHHPHVEAMSVGRHYLVVVDNPSGLPLGTTPKGVHRMAEVVEVPVDQEEAILAAHLNKLATMRDSNAAKKR